MLELIRNHERWWSGTRREGWLGNEPERRFLVEAAALLAEQGKFLAFALEVDGRPIAWNIGARDGTAYFENIVSFDREHKQCAPGVLLGILAAKSLIERGVRELELGPGFDERKRGLGAVSLDYPRLRGHRGWTRTVVAAHRLIFGGHRA